jgi:hypothetical protein
MKTQALLAHIGQADELYRTDLSLRRWDALHASHRMAHRGGDWLAVWVTDRLGRLDHVVVFSTRRLPIAVPDERLAGDRALSEIQLWLRGRHLDEVDASPDWASTLFADEGHLTAGELAAAQEATLQPQEG